MRWSCAVLMVLNSPLLAQTWTQGPDLPGTARDDAAAFSHYCKVYVGTGMQVGWSLTNDWWRWDVIQSSWQQVASLPASPRQYATAGSIEGIGYLFGGLDATVPLNELWAYDTEVDQWTTRSPLPSSGRYASTSFAVGDKLYVVGGLIAGGTALNELWEYDPATDAWTQRADLPGVPRHRATAVSTWCGTGACGLVIGGATEAYLALDEVWRYEPSTDSWFAAAPLPEARFGAAATLFIDRPLLMAGTTDNSVFHADGFLYNPVSDTWEPFGELLPNGRRGGTMGFSHQCPGYYSVYYGAGLDQDLVRHNDWFGTGFVFSIPDEGSTRLSVFPDPASDHITLGIDASWTMSTYILRDASGRIIHRGITPVSRTLPITQLAAGRYELELSHDNKFLHAPFIKLP